MPSNAVKIMAPSGRYAVYARLEPGKPWVQVESVNGEANADEMVQDLEFYSGGRKDAIESCTDEEWGKNAAVNPPQE